MALAAVNPVSVISVPIAESVLLERYRSLDAFDVVESKYPIAKV